MLKTVSVLRDELREYAYPDNKISRMVNDGELIPVSRGLYETEANTPGYLLAGGIYGRSYLSFEYALSYYGLIPERVNVYSSATFRKKKAKEYVNSFGRYTYRDVPDGAFPYGINVINQGEYYYSIASPEKAVCDYLYMVKPVHNKSELYILMFENMRLDIDAFMSLNMNELRMIAEKYNSTNTKILLKLKEVKQ